MASAKRKWQNTKATKVDPFESLPATWYSPWKSPTRCQECGHNFFLWPYWDHRQCEASPHSMLVRIRRPSESESPPLIIAHWGKALSHPMVSRTENPFHSISKILLHTSFSICNYKSCVLSGLLVPVCYVRTSWAPYFQPDGFHHRFLHGLLSWKAPTTFWPQLRAAVLPKAHLVCFS